jgi:ubiquinone/menaquinone biosynthesis C-methylase UbiE
MTDHFRPDDDEAPASEPSTLITNVSPATDGAQGPGAHARKSAAPSPIGDEPSVIIASPPPSAVFPPEPGTTKKARTRMTLRIPDDEVARPSQPNPPVSSVSQGPASVASSGVASSVHPSGIPGALPQVVAPPPHPVHAPITAQRIINLSIDTPTRQIPVPSSPPVSGASGSPPAPAVSPSPAPPRPVSVAPALPEEDSWTPFQPTVADHERSPDSSQSVDISISIETGPDEHEGQGTSGAAALPAPTAPANDEPARDLPAVAMVVPAVATETTPDLPIEPAPDSPAHRLGSSGEFTEVVVDEEDEASRVTVDLKATYPGTVPLPLPFEPTTQPRVPIHRLPPAGAPVSVRVPLPPARARTDATLDADEIGLESAPDSLPPPSSSEPSEAELSPEDFVSVEAVTGKPRVSQSAPPPPMRPRASSVPNFPASAVPKPPPSNPSLSRATIKTTVAPEHVQTAPKPHPLIVPSASPLAPPPMTDAASAARKRARPWWEDLFNDDFIRTMAKITDPQIAKEVDFIEESLGLDKGAMVLDLACGTGRHAIELTRREYQVVGFDLSLAMLAKAADEAQDRNQKINFVQGDMREMTFDGTFDGVYCWNTSFGFFEEEKNAAVIANVQRALKPGGQVLLDVANRDFIAQQCPSLVWFEGDGCVCMDDMTIDWITSRMKVKRTMMMDDGRSREIEYSIRLYSLHELGKLLHDQGFRVSQVSGRVATPGVFFGANSPRTLILAEKK